MAQSGAKFERQCALELDSYALGIDRYLVNMMKIHDNPDKDNTVLTPEQRLMKGYIENVTHILKHKISFGEKRGGSKVTREMKKFYKVFDPVRLAFLSIRYCLNCDPKNNALVGLCVGLGKHIEKDYEYLQFQEKAPAYLSQVERNLKSSHIHHRQRVLDHAIQKVEYEKDGKKQKGIQKLNWIDEKRFYYGKFLIECLTEAKPKFFNITHQSKMKRISNAKYGFAGQVKFLVFEKTDECIDLIHKAHDKLADMSPLIYPFIIKPKDWTSAYGGGFWTQYKSLRTKILRTRNKNAIKIAEEYGLQSVMTALNTIQATKWRINKRILDIIDLVDKADLGIGDIPVRENKRIEVDGCYPLEEKCPWTDVEFKQLKNDKNYELLRWVTRKAVAHDLFNRQRSKRQTLIWKLRIAKKFKDEPELYFVWNCDYRGRIYCYQPFINPQVDDSGKALIEFAESKPLGEHGLKHLMIHGANVFGFDKATLNERVQWVIDHEAEIINSAENPLDGMGFWQDADKPFNFLAFCFEYADYKQNPDTFESRLPVQQDGTCSGLQHYSALLKDDIGGKVVNLVPDIKKADVYDEVAKIVNIRLKKEAEIGIPEEDRLTIEVLETVYQRLAEDSLKGGDEGKYAKAWLSVGVDRKICKRNVMTFCYGATRTGFTQQLIDYILKEGIRLPNVDTFKACNYLGGINWSAIEETLIKSVEAMKFFQKIAFLMGKAHLDICWNNEVDLRVNQDYPKTTTKQIKTYWGGTRIDPRFSHDKVNEKNAVGSRNGIAPNFIHSMDGSHLMLTALKCAEQGITAFSFIHDSFGTHAADMEVMARILRETFVEMYSGDLLSKFVDDVRQQMPDELLEDFEQIVQDYKPKMGSLDVSCVQTSPYFFS